MGKTVVATIDRHGLQQNLVPLLETHPVGSVGGVNSRWYAQGEAIKRH